MKEKEKYLVDKIQGIFTNLQSARKESRANDIVMFEEQMHQLLREWKAELESPATSLAVCLLYCLCIFFPPSCKQIELNVFLYIVFVGVM